MFLEDIEVGMRVVPVSHTIGSAYTEYVVKDAFHSVAWRRAIERQQPYLIVVAIDHQKERILCNVKPVKGGDYFKEFDLEPYEN